MTESADWFYLGWGVGLSLVGLAATAAFNRLRQVALLSGLCAAPLGLADVVFVPEYWHPPHLVGAWLSIEGVLFSFGNGILLWLAAAAPFGARVESDVRFGRLLARYLGCSLAAIALVAALWRGGLAVVDLPIMSAGLIVLAIVGAFILGRRPDAWPFALAGALGFVAIYALELFLVQLFAPSAPLAWAPAIRAGSTLFGFPIEEMVWALVYGAVWPLAVAYGSGVTLNRRPAPFRSGTKD